MIASMAPIYDLIEKVRTYNGPDAVKVVLKAVAEEIGRRNPDVNGLRPVRAALAQIGANEKIAAHYLVMAKQNGQGRSAAIEEVRALLEEKVPVLVLLAECAPEEDEDA